MTLKEIESYRANHPLSWRLFAYRDRLKYGIRTRPAEDSLDLLAECIAFIEKEEERRLNTRKLK